MDQKDEIYNSAFGDGRGNGVRMSTSFHSGTRLNLPFYGQSTDSIVVYVLTLVVLFFLAVWNRYLVAVKDKLEHQIIAARALESIGRLPLHRRRALFKARFSPDPRFVRINRENHPRADDGPIEMLANRGERLHDDEVRTDTLSPIESTAPKSVSYYIWMRALVELLRALIAFILMIGIMGLNIGVLCVVLAGVLAGELIKGWLHAPAGRRDISTTDSSVAMKLSQYQRAAQILVSLAIPVSSHGTDGRPGHGFIGYGISMYKPVCAFACRASITNPLDCNGAADHNMGMDMSSMAMDTPSPSCYANNDPFLQTLAYCMYTHCAGIPVSALENYWDLEVAGSLQHQPSPKESYQKALGSLAKPPTTTLNASAVLDSLSLIDEETYLDNYNTLSTFADVETSHETYGLVLLLTGAMIPIASSLLRFVPFPAVWRVRFNAVFIDPPVVGRRHSSPILDTFFMPTRGQALFIAYLLTINIILCAVGFRSANPSTWYASKHDEILTYVANRAGVLSFANIPLLVLYTGRNNFLLWLTNWSHSTFLLLHRWVAFICTLEACLHSAIYLQIYVANNKHSTESKLPYWIWGVIATLALAVLIPSSTWPIRKRFYELFLAWHVILSFLALLACYWHIWYRYGHQWGYETWIYMAFGIWAFERVFRVLRLACHGIRKAYVTVLDDEYLKVEVPGVHAKGHVYLYFPTLTWRVWENHPFSAIASFRREESMERKIAVVSQDDVKAEYLSKNGPSVTTSLDSDKTSSTPTSQDLTTDGYYQPCLTFFVLEGSYPPSSMISDHWSNHPNVIAIAGGAGITALVPDLCSHRGGHTLFWASRSKALIESAQETVGNACLHGLNMRIYHDRRMDIPKLLTEEIQKYQGVSVCVVVSGPARMADEVRHVVSEMRDALLASCLMNLKPLASDRIEWFQEDIPAKEVLVLGGYAILAQQNRKS
ncbi:hypothetical protein CNMCM7691_006488 [Aspergillus felis]|uniref:Ferric oxidoreductase domain-containing protein n=1 Tax=Aspergillus felis TaxID=1287682 RepID=A0A8H6QM60_9EURO|nr:hypothetical protein CNMCM7691_006488 [Aspergillus felis]